MEIREPEKAAMISADGCYRYALWRTWPQPLDGDESRILFVMLNPSTADATRDDPTIRRCVGFAQRWGYTHLTVANLYAWRATKPADLFDAVDPVGPLNDSYLRSLAEQCHLIVGAWGAHGARDGRGRDVRRLLYAAARKGRDRRPPVYCLGTTKSGEPRHPLYVRADTPLVPL